MVGKVLPLAAVKEAVVLIVVSVLIGITANYLNPKGIELFTDLSTSSVSDSLLSADPNDLAEPVVLSTDQAIRLQRDGNAVFIDARERHEFEKAHIPAALLLPYETFFEHEDVIDSLPNDKWLICYCDGPPCDLGELLAYELFMRGFSRTAVYEAGLNEWALTEEVETGL